jgi:hypothetical protein
MELVEGSTILGRRWPGRAATTARSSLTIERKAASGQREAPDYCGLRFRISSRNRGLAARRAGGSPVRTCSPPVISPVIWRLAGPQFDGPSSYNQQHAVETRHIRSLCPCKNRWIRSRAYTYWGRCEVRGARRCQVPGDGPDKGAFGPLFSCYIRRNRTNPNRDGLGTGAAAPLPSGTGRETSAVRGLWFLIPYR